MWVRGEARDDPRCLGIEFRSYGCTMGTLPTELSFQSYCLRNRKPRARLACCRTVMCRDAKKQENLKVSEGSSQTLRSSQLRQLVLLVRKSRKEKTLDCSLKQTLHLKSKRPLGCQGILDTEMLQP